MQFVKLRKSEANEKLKLNQALEVHQNSEKHFSSLQWLQDLYDLGYENEYPPINQQHEEWIHPAEIQNIDIVIEDTENAKRTATDLSNSGRSFKCGKFRLASLAVLNFIFRYVKKKICVFLAGGGRGAPK